MFRVCGSSLENVVHGQYEEFKLACCKLTDRHRLLEQVGYSGTNVTLLYQVMLMQSAYEKTYKE